MCVQRTNVTFPKIPLPSTVRKWKSSTEYFLNLGIVVAGAVIRPDRWNCANVYEVSVHMEKKENSKILATQKLIFNKCYLNKTSRLFCMYTVN